MAKRIYVVYQHGDHWDGDADSMRVIKAHTDREAITEATGYKDEDGTDVGTPWEDIEERLEMDNYDTGRSVTVFDVEKNKIIFGEQR
jgi:hypothetical protein